MTLYVCKNSETAPIGFGHMQQLTWFSQAEADGGAIKCGGWIARDGSCELEHIWENCMIEGRGLRRGRGAVSQIPPWHWGSFRDRAIESVESTLVLCFFNARWHLTVIEMGRVDFTYVLYNKLSFSKGVVISWRAWRPMSVTCGGGNTEHTPTVY